MALQFLGTGAADWKEEHWSDGTPGRRFLTCALLSDDVLIDCGPTLFRSAAAAGASLEGVRFVFVTHLHCDHFSEDSLRALAERGPFTLCTEAGGEKYLPSVPGMTVLPLTMWEPTTVGGYRVTALPANHVVDYYPDSRPVHYVIETPDGHKLFWGCDGSWLFLDVWHELQHHSFDMMVLDGTFGNAPGLEYYFEHNTMALLREMTQVFYQQKIVRPGGSVWANHFSRGAHPDPEALRVTLRGRGIGMAEDGLIVPFPGEA